MTSEWPLISFRAASSILNGLALRDRMRHHHALLQLASFHYATGGLDLAKDVRLGSDTPYRYVRLISPRSQTIDEATRGARTAGDAQCLKHCLR